MGKSCKRVLKKWRPPPWNDRADTIVRVLHPRVAAGKLGVTIKFVNARRAELALPDVKEAFARGISRPGRIPWTATSEANVIRTRTPRDAATLLGLTVGTVYRRRQVLGIAKPYKRRKLIVQDLRYKRRWFDD